MKALGVKSQCLVCQCLVAVPKVSDFEYGAFVLFSDAGEARGLNAFEDSAFDEVSKMVKACELIANLTVRERSEIFHLVFPVSCDPDSRGRPFRIGPLRCPECGSRHLSLSDEGDIVELSPVTHFEWDKRTATERQAIVRDAVQSCVNQRKT